MSLPLPVETDRLTLRRYRETDYDDLLKLLSNPEVARFLLYDARTPAQVRDALALRMSGVPLDAAGQALSLAVIERDSGRHVGDVTFFLLDTEHRLGEIGFVFHPEFQGRGYATEAVTGLLRLGFDALGLHRIIGRLDARNDASAGVLRRLGMREEAHFVRNELIKGEWTDELVYAVLEDEWRARR